jgi:hypothetical protein
VSYLGTSKDFTEKRQRRKAKTRSRATAPVLSAPSSAPCVSFVRFITPRNQKSTDFRFHLHFDFVLGSARDAVRCQRRRVLRLDHVAL